MKKKIRYFILKLAYPFLRLVGKIHMPYSHKQLSGEDYYAIKDKLVKGDVFITLTLGEATNLAIPGHWSHGALYVGEKNGIPQVCEAVGKGVVVRPLVDFILEKDEVRVLRPAFCDEETMGRAADEAVKQTGAEYDYGFQFTIEPKDITQDEKLVATATHRAFYCVELIVWSYIRVMKDMPFKLRKNFGEPEVTADDFARAHKHWKQVWDKKENGTTWG